MKLQYMEMDLTDRNNSALHEPIEVNSIEEAVRVQMFKPDYAVEQYEIDDIVADFVEKDNMFINDGDVAVFIFFKL